jgi:hypothetical protein
MIFLYVVSNNEAVETSSEQKYYYL